jgi:hypothetical protein
MAVENFRGERLRSFYDGIRRVAELVLNDRMEEDRREPSGFDGYRSLADSNLMIFVPQDEVPPFRFKANGWEFLQSSTELDSAMKTRIAEKRFFMFRVNADQTGWTELTDLPSHSPSED